jgi:hypothetical protein
MTAVAAVMVRAQPGVTMRRDATRGTEAHEHKTSQRPPGLLLDFSLPDEPSAMGSARGASTPAKVQ